MVSAPLDDSKDPAISPLRRQPTSFPWNLKLVPAEPTSEMIAAALDCQDADPEDGPECEMYYAYLAMLQAVPAPAVDVRAVGHAVFGPDGAILEFNKAARYPAGNCPAGLTEEPLFAGGAHCLPSRDDVGPDTVQMSGQLLKTLCQALLGENPALTRAMAEELFSLFPAAG